MVKVTDFSEFSIKENLPWDVVEDLCVFMKNDSNFYRRNLYPVMLTVQGAVKEGGKYNKKEMLPVVERAIRAYIKKFKIKKRPQDLITDAEKLECVDRLLKDEVDNFRKGMY
jgi:hypothetical protein